MKRWCNRWRQPQSMVGVYNALILGGSLLGVAFVLPEGWFLSLGALLPVLWALQKARRWQQVFRWSYLAFFFYHGVANWWIGSWQVEADPFLRLSGVLVWLVHPLFFTLPWLGWWMLHRRWGTSLALWSLPLLWIAFEWLHSLGDLGYPWLALGNLWLPWLAGVQMADIGGVWLVSGWIVLLNVLLWKGVSAAIREQWHRSGWFLLGWGVAILLPASYGAYRLETFAHHSGKQLTVAIVQPNINPWRKWETLKPWQNIQRHIQLLDSALRTSSRQPDLTIWSETAIPFWITWQRYRTEFFRLRRWVDSTGIAVLTGFPDLVFYQAPPTPGARKLQGSNLWYETFNAVLLLQPGAADYQTYHKMRLTPFAEHVPYAEVLFFLQDWIQWGVGISSWAKGRRQNILWLRTRHNDTLRLGAVICIESIFPRFVAGFVRKGAEALVIITNDGWFSGTPGPYQHFEIARMRAIETRRVVLRCANTGISGIIAPSGEVVAQIPDGKQGVLVQSVVLSTGTSLYLRWGDWVAYGSLVIVGGMLIGGFRRRRFKEGARG